MNARSPAADAVSLLRRHFAGVARVSDRSEPVRFVIDRRSGLLVLPLTGADHLELLLPDDTDPEMALLLETAHDHAALASGTFRWQVYHDPENVGSFSCYAIGSARARAETFDADDLALRFDWAPEESALCRLLNESTPKLAAACARRTGARLGECRAIGADPDGIDVRTRVGVARVEFLSPADDIDAARAQASLLLAGASP